MDDSISCSPTVHKEKSFHIQRQKRKCKRKNLEKVKQQSTDPEQSVQLAERIYEVNDEINLPLNQTFQVISQSPTRREQQLLHYEMFEDISSLADFFDCERAVREQKQKKGLRSTQGFQTASQSLMAAFNEDSRESDLLGIETEFGLTKTQLFQCCDRVDQNDPNLTAIGTSIPIIDVILHDFCSSPEYIADELMINDAETAPPSFRFHGQKIKTYSRSKPQNVASKKQELCQQIEDAASRLQPMEGEDDDDRVSSCSSDLSMQEDLTNSMQHASVVMGNIDLNSSHRICQNLLNLSAFFTASNTEEDSIDANVKECDNLNINMNTSDEHFSKLTLSSPTELQIVAEDFNFDKINSEMFCEDIPCSFADYHWFSSQQIIQSPVELKEHVENTPVTTPICDKELSPGKNCDNKPLIDEAIALDVSFDSKSMLSKNCGKMENKKNFVSKETNVSFKSDDWFNDDFYYDFNTEDILNKTKDLIVSQSQGTSKIDVSKSASVLNSKHSSIIHNEHNDDEKPCTSRQAMQNIKAIQMNKGTVGYENKLKDFDSDSKIDDQGDELSQWLLDDVANLKCNKKMDSSVVGFCTAGNKSIEVSEAAKQKAASIVAELPVRINKDKEKSDTTINIEKIVNNSCTNIELNQWLLKDLQLKQSTVVGGCTAGNKSVQISDTAKRKETSIDAALPELQIKISKDNQLECSLGEVSDSNIHKRQPDEEHNFDDIELSQWLLDDATKQNSDPQLEPPVVVGFSTAGKKSIQVSEAAKRKAASLVLELPELPVKCKRESDPTLSKENDIISNEAKEHDSDDIELSQWLLNDAPEQKSDPELEAPIVVGFSTAGKKSIQVSEAAKRKAASLVLELPELPVKCKRKSDPTVSKENIDVISNEVKEHDSDDIELSQWLLDDATKQNSDPQLEPPVVVGFSTAGKKSIQVSEAAKRKAASLVLELPELPVKCKRKSDPTVSKENIDVISNEVKEHDSDDIELSQWLLNDAAEQKSDPELEAPIVVGFSTAGIKSIEVVSEAAKSKAASLVLELPELPVKCKRKSDPTLSKENIDIISNEAKEHDSDDIELSQWLLDDAAEQKSDPELEAPIVVGFSTAGKKSIQVSEAAKRKAASLVLELPELPVKCKRKSNPTVSKENIDVISNEVKEHDSDDIELSQWLLDDATKQNSDPQLEPPVVVGFSTAGKKSIQVSEAAKRKAASIVLELPELPVKCKRKSDPTVSKENIDIISNEAKEHDSDDIELSQWLLDDATKQKSDPQLEPPVVVGFSTAGKKSIQVSEAAKRKAASIVLELPELPVKCKRESDPTVSKENIDIFNEAKDCDDIELSQWLLLDDAAKLKCENELERPTVGICTADNKCIKDSDPTKFRAAAIISELPQDELKSDPSTSIDKFQVSANENVNSKVSNKLWEDEEYNCDDVELSQWLLDDDARQKPKNPQLKTPIVGFCTARNKNIKVSDAAKQKAAAIISELPELPNKNTKLESNNEVITKCKLYDTSIEKSNEDLKKNNDFENNMEIIKCALVEDTIINSENKLETTNNIDEFSNLNSGTNLRAQNISIISDSEKSKINARINLLKWKFRSVDFSNQQINDSTNREEVSKGLQRRLSLLNEIITKKPDTDINSTTRTQLPSSYPTTSKRKLEENNERSVEKIMKLNNAEDDAALNDDCYYIKLNKHSLNGVLEQITGADTRSTVAGNRTVHLTQVARRKESDLLQFPRKNINKKRLEENENIPIANGPNLKNTRSIIESRIKSSEIALRPTQTLEIFSTPQASFQQSQSQSAFKGYSGRSPLARYTKSSLKSRKNLLSFNKNQNFQLSQKEDEIDNGDHTGELDETPVKQKSINHMLEIYQTPENTTLTASTPQPLKSKNSDKSYDFENDFQHIKWQQPEGENDGTGEFSKTLTNSATKPSPKERIERLRMYGDPPALSPITTTAITLSSLPSNRSFRAPGLRRRRILPNPK